MSGTRSSGAAAGSPAISRSTIAAAAPRSSAAATKSWPSWLGPRSATNRSPAARLRVSIETPVATQSVEARPAGRGRGFGGGPQRGHQPTRRTAIGRRSTREFARDRGIVEGIGLGADDLAGFVPFAGDDQQIARRELGDRRRDRLAAVADLDRARRRLEDGAPDIGRRLGPRIVVGDIDAVGQAGRHLSHQGPLAGVAVAAAAEQRNEPAAAHAGAMRSEPSPAHPGYGRNRRRSRRLPRCSATNCIRPGTPVRPARASAAAAAGPPVAMTKPERGERVHRLELAGKRQHQLVPLARKYRGRGIGCATRGSRATSRRSAAGSAP